MGDRRIHQREPDAHEYQHRGELHALGEGTDDQRRGNDGERHLEGDEHAFRHGAGEAVGRQATQECTPKSADERIEVGDACFHARRVERQAVAVDHPQDAHQAGDGEALHHDREDVLGTDHAAVEQRQAWNRHEQHQRSGCEHPCRIAGIKRCLLRHGDAGAYQRQKGS